MENPESFTDLNDNELEDQTENFITKLIEEAQELLDECKNQSEEIEDIYINLLKYFGDDPKKLMIEDLINIMEKFRNGIENGKRSFIEQQNKLKRKKMSKVRMSVVN